MWDGPRTRAIGNPVNPILWHSCGMDEVAIGSAWMDTVEMARFARMRFEKRRTEARLGRWTAKQTVSLARGRSRGERDLTSVVVRNAPDGAPELFIDGVHQPTVIAMTDRADWAVTALRDGPERIGCDLELIEPRSPQFVTDYLTDHERMQVTAGDVELLANLMWSAKESSLKVLRTGLRRDTRTVEVHLDDPAAGSTGAWSPFVVLVDGGANRHHGWWIRYGEFVLTVAAEIPVDQPVALIDPPPLASAVPAHAWMDSLPPGE